MQPITPAITSGLTGIRSATARLDRAAAQIASSGLPTVTAPNVTPPPPAVGVAAGGTAAAQGDDLVGNLVQVRLSVIETAANVRSVDAAIEAYQSVLAIGREQR